MDIPKEMEKARELELEYYKFEDEVLSRTIFQKNENKNIATNINIDEATEIRAKDIKYIVATCKGLEEMRLGPNPDLGNISFIEIMFTKLEGLGVLRENLNLENGEVHGEETSKVLAIYATNKINELYENVANTVSGNYEYVTRVWPYAGEFFKEETGWQQKLVDQIILKVDYWNGVLAALN